MRGEPTEVVGSVKKAPLAEGVPVSPAETPPEPVVPAPPEAPAEVLAWAVRHGIAERLDDPYPAGGATSGVYDRWYWPGRGPESGITFRTILVDETPAADRLRRYWGLRDNARALFHEMGRAAATHRWTRAWMEANGCDPSSEPLAGLLVR